LDLLSGKMQKGKDASVVVKNVNGVGSKKYGLIVTIDAD
jgi:hypothetical protein